MSHRQQTPLEPIPGVEISAEMQAMLAHIDALDPFIHQPTQLRLLAELSTQATAVSFRTLMERLPLRSSALSMQRTLLEQAGLTVTEKRLKGRFAETWIGITPAGREALARHLDHLCAALALSFGQEGQQ